MLSDPLSDQGFVTGATIHANLGTAALVEHALKRDEGKLTKDGALLVDTGKFTGRSVKDKFIVRDATTEDTIDWGAINQPMSGEHWATLKADFLAALKDQDELYVADLFGGSQPEYRVNVRVINEMAWHNLFIRTLLVRPTAEELANFSPEYTIINLPSFKADPARHGCRSDTVIAVNLTEKLILIGNTEYSGEMKKGVFGLLNFLLPAQGVMPMHCSANIGPDGRSAIFFGLSGTGKTTLSADASRTLIGDDEHGWSDQAVFNFEGGCYAKMINLSAEGEPEIYATTKMFGTILENVTMDRGHARARLHRREQDREYPRRLSDRVHSQYQREEPRSAAVEHHPSHRRRIRRAAADRPAHARAGDVPLPVGLHRQGRRNRNRRDRTAGDLLDLLRRRLHAAPPERLRQPAQEANRRRRCAVLAGQHRLVGRQGDRSGYRTHAHQGDPRAAQRRARRQPERRRVPQGSRTSVSRCPSRSRASTPSCSIRVPPGPTRTTTTAPRRSWSSCSSTTSSSSPAMSTKACAMRLRNWPEPPRGD